MIDFLVAHPVVVFIIAVALAFDFLNGFHDAANSIATVVSTRVLSPRTAVVWAAFFNFVAAFVLGTHVAKTIGKGLIDLEIETQEVILAGLVGAIVGVGATRRFSAVKWGVAGRIVWAWIVTIPVAALVAAATFLLGRLLFG
jgi:phosphate/sulfate permease